jgi:hypothetical protein
MRFITTRSGEVGALRGGGALGHIPSPSVTLSSTPHSLSVSLWLSARLRSGDWFASSRAVSKMSISQRWPCPRPQSPHCPGCSQAIGQPPFTGPSGLR